MDRQDIDKKARAMQRGFDELMEALSELPPNRGLAIARTEFETGMMWAKHGILIAHDQLTKQDSCEHDDDA